MATQVGGLLLTLPVNYRILPVIENRVQFAQVLDSAGYKALVLRHCSLFDLQPLLEKALQRGIALYAVIDTINGLQADSYGMQFLYEQLHICGIISHHAKTLALGKEIGLETIQRIFAVDSSGLESSLATLDTRYIDLLDISPAPVIPYIAPTVLASLELPFIGSGLISTFSQVRTILRAGASAVAVTGYELWS